MNNFETARPTWVTRTMLKGKIHRATVTGANLNYVGSITIDRNLMDGCDLHEYEMVHIVNINNGARFETYVIEGQWGSGTIQLNGAAARLAQVGDKIIILNYAQMAEPVPFDYQPLVVHVDEDNQPVSLGDAVATSV